MLKLSEAIIDIPVLSLRAGNQVGTATELIINPNNLKIEGWYVHDRFGSKKLILLSSDVRELSSRGLIINDQEVLSETEELVRLKPIIEIGFILIGKQVVSQSGRKYGKVTDFAAETESLLIKKIYAGQSIIKNLTGGSTSIDRTQVIEITNTKIIIEDPTEKASERAVAASPVNS
ncbi:MAG TPA: hypothetical protein VFW77_00980 [Candidatus Saccharimonadales bacterium]|nr:hypothetical protein [Candidatus Saccharimonadales bacterium]